MSGLAEGLQILVRANADDEEFENAARFTEEVTHGLKLGDRPRVFSIGKKHDLVEVVWKLVVADRLERLLQGIEEVCLSRSPHPGDSLLERDG